MKRDKESQNHETDSDSINPERKIGLYERLKSMPYDNSRVGEVMIIHVPRKPVQPKLRSVPSNKTGEKIRPRTIELINSEGTILALIIAEGGYGLKSLISDRSGYVYYFTNREDLSDYLDSKITLNQLYMKSESPLVIVKLRSGEQKFLKEELEGRLKFGDSYFNQLSSGIRTNEKITID